MQTLQAARPSASASFNEIAVAPPLNVRQFCLWYLVPVFPIQTVFSLETDEEVSYVFASDVFDELPELYEDTFEDVFEVVFVSETAAGVGSGVGIGVDIGVGSNVGSRVGAIVGVGSNVGANVGTAVGSSVAAIVGEGDGAGSVV